MKTPTFLFVLLTLSFASRSQVNEDSSLLANSDKWKVEQHRGLFGLSRPEFGPVNTLSVSRLDSAKAKRKMKDSSELEGELSSQGLGLDHYKFVTVEKTKTFRMHVVVYSDTSDVTFSIASTSKEKKESVVGAILRGKREESQAAQLDYKRDVTGFITTAAAGQWTFAVKDFTSGARITEAHPFPTASISGGWLVSPGDSLFISGASSFGADLVLEDANGKRLGALQYVRKPFNAWLRRDIDTSHQVAIASLFAFIFAIKDF